MTIIVSIKQSYAMLAVERSVSFSIMENNLCRSIFISRGLPIPIFTLRRLPIPDKNNYSTKPHKKRGSLNYIQRFLCLSPARKPAVGF